MLNSSMLSIFQRFHAIPLRSPLISLRSKWRLTGFSRRFTPKNPVRLHKPFGQLPRWGAKNVLPLNLIALRGSGYAGERFARFSGLTEIRISHFCVLRPSLTGKKDRPTAGLSRSPSQGFLHQKSEASRLRFIDLQSSVFSF